LSKWHFIEFVNITTDKMTGGKY